MKSRRKIMNRAMTLLVVLGLSVLLGGCSFHPLKILQERFAGKKEEKTASEDSSQAFSFVEKNSLILYLSENELAVGEQGKLRVTVLYGSEIVGEISIVDDRGETVCILKNDGSGIASEEIEICENAPRLGELTAFSGKTSSSTSHFYIQPEVTEEMMDALYDTAEGLVDYVEDSDFKKPYSKDALSEVKNYLKQQANVKLVQENNGVLFYQTRDGLLGSYGLGRYKEGYAGFSNPDAAFASWQSGEDVSGMVLASEKVVTNQNCFIVTPDYSDATMEQHTNFCLALAENEDYGRQLNMNVVFAPDQEARKVLREGSFVDCGMWILNAHGSTVLRSDGSPMLFFHVGSGDRQEMLDFIRDPKGQGCNLLWSGFDDRTENYRATLDVSENDGTVETTVRASARYLESVLQNKTFDNTIVYLCVCHAMSDEKLKELFLEHGASMVIGCEKEYLIGYSMMVLRQIFDSLRTRDKNGNYGTITQGIEDVHYLSSTARTAELFSNEKKMKKALKKAYRKSFFGRQTVSFESRTQDCSERVYSGSGRVSGKIFTKDGQNVGLKNARVAIYRWLNHNFRKEREFLSDEEGSYRFEGLDYGIYIVHAKRDDMEDYVAVILDEKETEAEPLYLGIKVKGTVTDGKTKEPLSNVEVVLETEQHQYIRHTDMEGFWDAVVAPGKYDIMLQYEGYQEEKLEDQYIKYINNQTYQFDMELNKKVDYYQFVKDELIPKYGLFETPQQGWMREVTDAWLKPEGILAASAVDLDRDGEEELLVIRNESTGETWNVDDKVFLRFQMLIEIYKAEDQGIVLASSMPFSQYYSNGVIEGSFMSANNHTQGRTVVTLVCTDNKNYIVCENSWIVGLFANGSSRNYWALEYNGDSLEYAFSFTQTAGGSIDFEHTGYEFENGNLIRSQVLYRQRAYQSFSKELTNFFEKYGIQLRSDIEEDNFDETETILSDKNRMSPILRFTNAETTGQYKNPFFMRAEIKEDGGLRNYLEQ